MKQGHYCQSLLAIGRQVLQFPCLSIQYHREFFALLFSVLNDECASVGHREVHHGNMVVYNVAPIYGGFGDHGVHVVELSRVCANISIEFVDLFHGQSVRKLGARWLVDISGGIVWITRHAK